MTVNYSKYENLYDFLNNIKIKPFGFEVVCKNNDNCCFGLESDVTGFLAKSLHKYKTKNVFRVKKSFSKITRTDWYKITMNYTNIDEARKIHSSQPKE